MELFTYQNTAPAASGRVGLPLSGKRVVVQPNMSKRGWPCNAGSRALENFNALEDASVLIRLEDNGAHLAGNSRMSELGLGLWGDTTVQAARQLKADAALLTDTMGEARVAAAQSGLFGFKPSWGIVSRAGLIGLVPSMECFGIAAPDLETITEIMTVIAGKDGLDLSLPDEEVPDFAIPEMPAKPCCAGVIKEMLSLLTAGERKNFENNLDQLKNVGMEFRELDFPEYSLFRPTHQVIAATEASSSAGKYDGVRYGYRSAGAKNWNDMYLNSRGEAFGTLIKSFLFQGAYFQFENYGAFENACRVRARLVRATAELFKDVDVIASPTCLTGGKDVAPESVRDIYDSFILTLPANLTGQPALSVPCPASKAGGAGVQLTAPRLGDARLLAIGRRLNISREGA